MKLRIAFSLILALGINTLSTAQRGADKVIVAYDGDKAASSDSLTVYIMPSFGSENVEIWFNGKFVAKTNIDLEKGKKEGRIIKIYNNKELKINTISFKIGKVFSPKITFKSGFKSLSFSYFNEIYELRLTNDIVILE